MDEGDVIFLRLNGKLQPVPRADYATEDLLQALLQEHPDLLSGEQLRPGDPVRWLFVTREAGVADGDRAGDRWSLDNLLVDQDAVPTLVEVKRSTDTRIRREVVGQLLDYAANASAWWPPGRIREMATRKHGSIEALNEAVCRLLPGADADTIEQFWADVDRNLAAGRLRLLFVADRIPTELRRVIEFLNAHMPSVEVLGVEIAQYQGLGAEAYVPRVVGQTEAARDARQLPRGKTTEAAFLGSIPAEFRPVTEALLEGASRRQLTIAWGQKGFSVRVPLGEKLASVFYAYPPGALGVAVPWFQAFLGYLPEEFREPARSAFQRGAMFRKSGEHSLNLMLEPGAVGPANAAVAALWEVVDSLPRQT